MARKGIETISVLASIGFSLGAVQAQEVAPEIEALVSDLATEGYTEFTLEDSIFTPPTLVAEQDGILLELELDPETFEVTETVVALDEDGDGTVSRAERRNGIVAEDLSAQASDRAREAVAQARARQQERVETRAANSGNMGNAAASATRADGPSNSNAGGNSGGNGNDNAGGNGGGNGNGNGGGNGRDRN